MDPTPPRADETGMGEAAATERTIVLRTDTDDEKLMKFWQTETQRACLRHRIRLVRVAMPPRLKPHWWQKQRSHIEYIYSE